MVWLIILAIDLTYSAPLKYERAAAEGEFIWRISFCNAMAKLLTVEQDWRSWLHRNVHQCI